jgi:hypothetical protein
MFFDDRVVKKNNEWAKILSSRNLSMQFYLCLTGFATYYRGFATRFHPQEQNGKPLDSSRYIGYGSQCRQGLVALGGEQQTFQVTAKAVPLVARREKIVESCGEGFEWFSGSGRVSASKSMTRQ